jgi:hypothetical protein
MEQSCGVAEVARVEKFSGRKPEPTPGHKAAEWQYMRTAMNAADNRVLPVGLAVAQFFFRFFLSADRYGKLLALPLAYLVAVGLR